MGLLLGRKKLLENRTLFLQAAADSFRLGIFDYFTSVVGFAQLFTHINQIAFCFRGDIMYRRIRDLREDRDLTQKQIAQMFGLSQTGYSKYETGENDIPTAVLLKLADFYQTSTDYLLGRSDKK